MIIHILITLLLGIINSGSDGSTHGRPTGHTDQCSDITSPRTACKTTDSRTDNRAEGSPRISTSGGVGSTAAEQKQRKNRYYQCLLHNRNYFNVHGAKVRFFTNSAKGESRKPHRENPKTKRKPASMRDTSFTIKEFVDLITQP